jgi:murein endopeptidase
VETNPANSHLGFDPQAPDENPSIAHGTPNNGTLEGGINLPDVGTGYIHFPLADPVDFDDWGTLALINLIEASGRCWIGDNTQPRMQSLDMSLQGGGDWSGHTSHQNGLDVDMRYLRTDDQEIGINIATDQAHYDQEATQRIIDCIIACGNVQGIFVDLANSRLEGAPVEHVNGHADHFHVRIYDPDGTDN